MSGVFFRLMLWPCMWMLPHDHCPAEWKKTFSDIQQCQQAAVELSHSTGMVTACVPYRVKVTRG